MRGSQRLIWSRAPPMFLDHDKGPFGRDRLTKEKDVDAETAGSAREAMSFSDPIDAAIGPLGSPQIGFAFAQECIENSKKGRVCKAPQGSLLERLAFNRDRSVSGKIDWQIMVVIERWWGPDKDKGIRDISWCKLVSGRADRVLSWLRKQETPRTRPVVPTEDMDHHLQDTSGQ